MSTSARLFGLRRPLATELISYGVALHGLIIIASTLDDQLVFRGLRVHVSSVVFGVPLLAGLTLLYLGIYLRRCKQTAWFVGVALYILLIIFNTGQVLLVAELHHTWIILWARNVLLPVLMLGALAWYRDEYTVKSDVRSFASALRFILLVLTVTFVYGVGGFLLLDRRDFHQSFSVVEAAHRTIDQFGLTTNDQLVPHTRRAKLFQDSLSVISVGAVAYAFISLFQPIRMRLSDQSPGRETARQLLEQWHGSSEDIFKLWPHDKSYFFAPDQSAGLAYGVHRGVALVVGDPFGNPRQFDELLRSFDELCRTNDWQPAFIHTEPPRTALYKRHKFSQQKIGQEAVLHLASFQEQTRRNKYFRHIHNKFTKQHFTTELLQPPHSPALVARLRMVSDDWLAQPGRAERRFMMGYFSEAYMQQGPVMVLRDEAGTIQAFINQVTSFDPAEANFDLLRHTHDAPGNSNDFLLLAFIDCVQQQGFERLNLGLCPLAGLTDAPDEGRGVLDNALRFLYANGDRFYSFSGLYRFKAKYEPDWQDRYIVYRGGIRTFTRVLNAINQAMKLRGRSRRG